MDQQTEINNKIKFAKSIQEALALNILIISPLRSNDFQIQLFKSNAVHSELTDDAKRNIYEDALYLEAQITKEKFNRFKLGEKGEVGNGKVKYDIKRLASHYQVSTATVWRTVKKGRSSVSTQSKKRPGRKKHLTPAKVS